MIKFKRIKQRFAKKVKSDVFVLVLLLNHCFLTSMRSPAPGVLRKILEKNYLGMSNFAVYIREISEILGERKRVNSGGKKESEFGGKERE